MKNHITFFLAVIAASLNLLSIQSCKNEPTEQESKTLDQLTIRLEAEPESLSPITANKSVETEVFEYIFISLGDYHPVTMELIPVLLSEIPSVSIVSEGPYAGSQSYTMDIKSDAVWEDGSPITAHDLIWTLKMANHPGVIAPGWKQLLQDLIQVEVDPENDKRFTMYVSGDYFLTFEAFLTAEVYPEYIYDAGGVLKDYTINELSTEDFAASTKAQDADFIELGKKFSSVEYKQLVIHGAGPYYLEKWETGQYISIKQKENYWGDNYPINPFLSSIPERIIFQILPDANVALTLLKNDELDFMDMGKLPSVAYEELKNNEVDDDLTTYTNQIPRIYYIALNNADPRLAEQAVRYALNACFDIDRIINQLEGGYGQKTNSIIAPDREEYNKQLQFIKFDIDDAIAKLEAAGWTDTDGDGIRDKIIDGKKEKLSLRFFNTGSALGQGILAIFTENALKAGIEIVDIKKSYRDTRRENMATGDFEMVASATTISESRQDPYISWHSSSIGSGGSNYSGYSNPEADRQMEIIRTSKDANESRDGYYRLQEIMLEDVPLIFMHMPLGRLAIDDDIKPMLSSKRPGYFANNFTLE